MHQGGNSMKKFIWFACAGLIGLSVCMRVLADDANSAAVQEPSKITAATDTDDNHPEIPEGTTCTDCHEIKIDANTTATQSWLSGDYAGFSPGNGMMPHATIRAAIVEAMGGKKHHRTSILATCLNNVPLSTTAEYALDPESMCLYGVHEKGTLKLLHLKQNPRFSLNWHRPFEKWGDTLCIQFIGRAELISGESPEFERILRDIYPYEEGADARKIPRAKYVQMAKQMMVMSKLTVEEATITNMQFRKNGNRPWQRWERVKDNNKNQQKKKEN